MTCPNCNRTRTRITNTINSSRQIDENLPPQTIRRTRKCQCGHKFKTLETHEHTTKHALHLIHTAQNPTNNPNIQTIQPKNTKQPN